MKLKRAQEIANNTLITTHKLVVGPNKTNSKFARVLEGAFRRDYLTLYTIVHLSEANAKDRAVFGDSCMDLCRKVLEDMVSIEYMLLQDKEKYAVKFIDFKAVETKRDLDYLRKAGAKVDPALEKDTEENFKKVQKKFEDSKGKLRKSWAGLDTESMINELLSNGVIKEDEKDSLIQTYLAGNYKNHFSPTDIFNFLHQDLLEFTNERDIILSLVAVTSSVTRLAVVFAQEFEVPDELKARINSIWKDLLSEHVVKDDKQIQI